MRLISIIGILAILVFLTAAGCQKTESNTQVSPSTPSTPVVTQPTPQAEETPKEAAAKGADVRILEGGFDPEVIEIAAGSTVTFKNMDSRIHLVVVTGGDRSPTLQPNDTWDLTLEEKGEYEITDAIFKFDGTIVVK